MNFWVWYLLLGYLFALYVGAYLYPKHKKTFTVIHVAVCVSFWLPFLVQLIVLFLFKLAEWLRKERENKEEGR